MDPILKPGIAWMTTEMLIEKLTFKKDTCQKEANMADNQVNKMKKVFGIEPE